MVKLTAILCLDNYTWTLVDFFQLSHILFETLKKFNKKNAKADSFHNHNMNKTLLTSPALFEAFLFMAESMPVSAHIAAI